jgi:hypothetical protein
VASRGAKIGFPAARSHRGAELGRLLPGSPRTPGGRRVRCSGRSNFEWLTDTLSYMVGYDDGRVACTDDAIILRRYSLWRARRITYQAIREVRQVPLASLGMVRIQGSGDFVHWFNYDPHRRHKEHALVLHILADKQERSALRTPGDADERVKPVITPDDPDSVIAELIAHGVKVSSGPSDAD